jgi:hypothetical protein
MSPFKQGDKVSIIPHRGKNEDGTVKHVIGVVTDPCKLTDMTRLDGSKVGFYVMVRCPSMRNISDPRAEDLGYHAASLELVA